MSSSENLASFTIRHAALMVGAAFVASCASEESPVEEPVAPVETAGFQSKPVKMPPRVKKLGKSSGIGLEEFFAVQQSGEALIYDVRVPYFYGIDHIPGAINWPYNEYEQQVQKRDIEIQKAIASGKKVVLYCFSLMCPEARNVAKKLARRDYEVHVLTSGIDAWREAGLPVESRTAGTQE